MIFFFVAQMASAVSINFRSSCNSEATEPQNRRIGRIKCNQLPSKEGQRCYQGGSRLLQPNGKKCNGPLVIEGARPMAALDFTVQTTTSLTAGAKRYEQTMETNVQGTVNGMGGGVGPFMFSIWCAPRREQNGSHQTKKYKQVNKYPAGPLRWMPSALWNLLTTDNSFGSAHRLTHKSFKSPRMFC